MSEVDQSIDAARLETAERIAEVYRNARENGGKIIGSHLLPDAPLHGRRAGLGVLYLVVELPEEKSALEKVRMMGPWAAG